MISFYNRNNKCHTRKPRANPDTHSKVLTDVLFQVNNDQQNFAIMCKSDSTFISFNFLDDLYACLSWFVFF